jgi:hypothetical protein
MTEATISTALEIPASKRALPDIDWRKWIEMYADMIGPLALV